MSVFRTGVAFFQTQWNNVLDDTCTIRSVAQGTGTYNKTTNTYDGTASTIYSGACLVRPVGATDTDHGQEQVELVDYNVFVPSDTIGLEPRQQITVDTIGTPTLSPLLAGQVLTVHEVEADSFNARVRLGCVLNRGGRS